MINSPVSVIIPCYNVDAFVRKAIDSILNQTYSNLEVWLIDDASTDNTRIILESYHDERIRKVFFDYNTKKVGAVNEVLKKVHGDFICFQDADDWSEPNRIERQLQQFLDQPDLGICFTNYRHVGNKSNEPGKIALNNEELKDEFFNYLQKKNTSLKPTVCATMMVSRAVLQATGGYHPYFTGKVAEDSHWVYRILKQFKGVAIDEVLYNYFIRENSFTQLQFSGENAKYAYSWQLLSIIIHKDIYEKIDLLGGAHSDLLKEAELQACEKALIEKIIELNDTKNTYEKSMSFRIGKTLLSPIRFINRIIKS